MTDAPKRIWASAAWAKTFETQDERENMHEYILASEHAALIREVAAERDESRAYALALEQELRGRVGRELLQAAEIAEADAKQLTEEALQWRADKMPFAAQFAEEQAKAGPRIAAAIRAAKATP